MISTSGALADRLCMPILHGNYIYRDRDRGFLLDARTALARITPGEVTALLTADGWRPNLTGAWLCGMKRWYDHLEIIGAQLLESRECFAGQGYCFALARRADGRSARLLSEYLDRYLPQPDKYYDQSWALGASFWIDASRHTQFATRFVEAIGPWQRFVADKSSAAWSTEYSRWRFHRIMEYSINTFD